jgi:hypothetical protein
MNACGRVLGVTHIRINMGSPKCQGKNFSVEYYVSVRFPLCGLCVNCFELLRIPPLAYNFTSLSTCQSFSYILGLWLLPSSSLWLYISIQPHILCLWICIILSLYKLLVAHNMLYIQSIFLQEDIIFIIHICIYRSWIFSLVNI